MAINTDQQKIDALLTRGVEAVYPDRETVAKELASGRKLRLYVGFDPTAPQLHIGHALQLKKLREFQDLGHEVIMLVGSFTAMIGDPTDKLATRTQLSLKEVLANAATYKAQASKILNFSGRGGAKLMFNHKWLAKMSFADVVEVASEFTVQQMLERDMFERRMADGQPVYLHEFLYPLMQGYDSVAMNVDGELGGSDQTFNMLAGRTLMKRVKDKEKFVVALKLLTNDEGKKMSKSEGGFVALSDAPEDMFGKLMSMHDSMILPYFELVTDVPMEEIEGMKLAMERGMNPRDVKMRLAHTVVAMFHDAEAASRAKQQFESVFQKGDLPEVMPEMHLGRPMNIVDVLVQAQLVSSRSDAKRMLEQKAVKVDGVVVEDAETELAGTAEGVILQRGKRQFVKLVK